MSSSTWEEQRHTPAQVMSPPDSYRPDHSYVPSEHGSRKNSNEPDHHGRGGACDGYASPLSAPRDYSDQGSVKGYGSGVKGYGSSGPHSHHDTHVSSHDHGSLKDFVNSYGNGGDGTGGDHRAQGDNLRYSSSRNGSVKEFGSDGHGSGGRHNHVGDATRGSSDCGGYIGDRHYSSGDHASNQDISDNYVSSNNPKDYVRPGGMSWLDRRSFHIGEPCAVPLDWDHHPSLRQVPPGEHQNYRQTKLEEWLSTAHKRRAKENFGAYIWRASALANSELRHRKKQCWGDEYADPLDKFVMRLFYGMKLKLERTESVVLGVDDETDILDILREECEELSKSGQLPFDQRSIQYTPLILSEMQERGSSIGGY